MLCKPAVGYLLLNRWVRVAIVRRGLQCRGRRARPLECSPPHCAAMQGSGFPNAQLRGWRYCRSAHPTEALFHLLPSGTRWCYHKGGEHCSQNIMITIDLIGERAYQRCWDRECTVLAPSQLGRVKAKHALSRPPASAMPTLVQLIEFERVEGCRVDDTYTRVRSSSC